MREFAPWEEHDNSSEPTTPSKSQGKKLVQDLGGFGQAGLDMVGSLPAMALGVPGFAEDLIRTHEPKEAFERLMGFASEHNILNHLPDDMLKLRDTEGYEVANKALAKSIGIFGQGAGNIAGVMGASPKGAEFADIGTQVGIMAGSPFLARGPRKGTSTKESIGKIADPEWYAQQRQNGPSMSLEAQKAVRETYDTPPWELDLSGVRTPPHEAWAPALNDTSLPYRHGDTGMDAYRPTTPTDVSIGRGMEPGAFERAPWEAEKGMEVTRELPEPKLATTELSLSDGGVGMRDKPDLRDFEQVQRDRSNEALYADRQPLGPDEMQRGPEQSPSLTRDPLGHYEASEFQKPRLKADLAYDYEGALAFEKAAIEEYRPEIRDGRMRTPEQASRLHDRNLGEFYDAQLATKLLHSTIRQRMLKEEGKQNIGLNPVRIGLEHIRDKSEVPYYRELAKKLLDDPEFKPDLELVKAFERADKAGDYTLNTHKIRMREGLIGSEQLLLHEAIHARTMAPIYAYQQWKASGGRLRSWEKHFSHLKAPIERLFALFEGIESKVVSHQKNYRGKITPDLKGWEALKEGKEHPLGRVAEKYGLTDVHEFIAEGFTNPAFQADLAQLKVPRELSGKGMYQYYWDAFLGSVKDMLGLKGERANTYLSELLRAGSDLMAGTSKENRIFYADMLDTQVQAGARIKDLHRKGIVSSLQEAAREFKLDQRPVDQMIEQDMMGKKIEDFTAKDSNLLWQSAMRLGSLVKENLLQDTTLAQIMKNKPGSGPAIRWTVDQMSRIERNATIKTKEALDTALKPFRRMYHNKQARAELIEGWKKWQENIGVRDLTRADFVTERQWDIYKNFQGVHDKILTEMNAMRETAGLKPIDRIPSYFHAMWEGDYRVFGYKADGTKILAQGFKTEAMAQKFARAYRKAHPDLKIDDAVHIQTDKYDLHTGRMNAFEDALRTMSADDPATKAILRTYHDILQHKGFGRTGIHKKGILGFLGTEDGAIGLRNMERAFDQYVNQAYRYMSNLEKQQVLGDLQKIPLEMRKQMPETMDFLQSYIRKSQGVQLDTMAWDKMAMKLSRAVGLGEGMPKRAIRGGSAIASLYWLTTPRFLLSQMGQYANAFPKMLQQFGVVDGSVAWVDGIKQALNPDATALEGAKWAAEKGYLDPTIKNMLSDAASEYPIGSKMLLLREMASYPAAKIEHHMVRLPTFVAFEKALRPYIKDKELRFQEAAEKTDYYMVNYGPTHSAMIYDKAGLAGVAARPLKQYSHNTWGQFIEYAKGLKDHGEVAPVAAFLGVQALMSGLKGVILVTEAAAIITFLNWMFDMDIPTPEKMLLKTDWVSDWMTYGIPSTLLQNDISSSVSAPSLPGLLSFPVLSFGGRIIEDMGNYVAKVARGKDTDQDRLRAAMAVTPNFMHETLKHLYTRPGGPTANPYDANLRGNYRRSDAEWLISDILGTKPLNEAKVDAMIRAGKQDLKRDMEQRMDTLDAIIDRVQNGKEVDPKLFERYIREGGDPSRMSATMMRRIKERAMTGPEREVDVRPPVSNSQFHRFDRMQQYLDKLNEGGEPLGLDPATGQLRPMSQGDEPTGPSLWGQNIQKRMEREPTKEPNDAYWRRPEWRDNDHRTDRHPGPVLPDTGRQGKEFEEDSVRRKLKNHMRGYRT